MTHLAVETFLPAAPSAVFEHCSCVAGFVQHFPYPVRWNSGPAQWQFGDTLDFSCRIAGVWWLRHVAQVVERSAGEGFTDEQCSGLYKHFRHAHSFRPQCGGTLLRDEVDFTFGYGRLLDDTVGLATHRAMFRRRHAALKQHFAQD